MLIKVEKINTTIGVTASPLARKIEPSVIDKNIVLMPTSIICI